MKQEMKLKPKYYDYILHGTKRIEIRLYDEKRQQLQLGDFITFIKDDEQQTESFQAKVVGLLRYQTLEELIHDFDIALLSDSSMTKNELLQVFEQFYTKEKQAEYGILGIRIQLL